MKTREEIFDYISKLMVEMFEIEPDKITEDAALYDDLDIDSIDAVDLIVELRSFIKRKITPEYFKHVTTVGDVVAAVERLLEEE